MEPAPGDRSQITTHAASQELTGTAGPERGVWTYDDWCRAGAFVENMAGQAYVAFVRLGTGRLGCDFGTITSDGKAEYWYCYDLQDLGAAASGQRPPRQIAPVSMTRVHYPLGRTVTGACFDTRTGRLYLCLNWAYPDGLESFPVRRVSSSGDRFARSLPPSPSRCGSPRLPCSASPSGRSAAHRR